MCRQLTLLYMFYYVTGYQLFSQHSLQASLSSHCIRQSSSVLLTASKMAHSVEPLTPFNYCCNLTDHRGLPIIHIESYRCNRQEIRTQMQNNRLYYIMRVHTKHKNKPSSHLAQQPNIYDLQTITYKYLSVWSTDTTLCS